ncbi:MAG TPA: efflux RND transporter permease subunit [Candidatus Wallbacteria bacterium]|nr:efflux RND transporter permease subunit [Candidatus Wallbacteria bacterium]
MLYEIVIKNHKAFIYFILAVTLALAPFARKNVIDNNIEENVLRDEKLSNYNEYLHTFGNDRLLVAAFKYDKIDAKLIRNLYSLEESLAKLKSVDRVISPVSILKQAFGLDTRESLEVWLKSEARINNYVKKLYNFTSVSKTILSAETKTASLIIRLANHVKDTDIKSIDEIIETIESDAKLGKDIKISGIPAIVSVIHKYTSRDQKLFTPVTMLIIIVILFALYRSAAGVLLPLIIIVLPLMWTQAVYNLNGNPTNFITSMIPPLLLGIGLTGAIHIATAYFERTRRLTEFDSGVLGSVIKDLAPPIIMCQVTTIFGFASLGTNGIGAIKHFGLYSGLGVLFTLILALFLMPALFAFFKITNQRSTDFQTPTVLLDFIADFVLKYKYFIVAVSFAAGAAGLYGVSMLEVETSLIKYLPPGHPEIIKGKFIEDNLFGNVPLQIVIKVRPEAFNADDSLETSLLNPSYCNKIAGLKNEILKIDNVNSAVSYVNFIQDYDREFSGEKNNIPPSADEIKDYLDFYRPVTAENDDDGYEITDIRGFFTDDTYEIMTEIKKVKAETAAVKVKEDILDGFITADYKTANIAVRINDVSSRKLDEIFDVIEKLAKKHLSENLSFYLTGRAYLWARTSEILAYNEIENFLLSVVLIFGVIMLYFRSVYIGAIALLPNILPIVILYGFMGLRGIAFNTVTGMIASVAIGMAVDDTIHYIYELRKNIRAGCLYESAIVKTLRSKGSSIIFTSIVTACAFSALMMSEFVPTKHFGILISFNIFMAVFFDLFLTPALMLILKPF